MIRHLLPAAADQHKTFGVIDETDSFSEWRGPRRLMIHDELSIEAREGLASAISGNASPDTVAASLKALGIKARS